MNIRKGIALAISALAIASGYPQNSVAETFTSGEFLAWPTDTRNFYLHTSIGMARLIASQNDKRQGDCISDWYFGNEAGAQLELTNAMQRFPTYHPRGVILAMIEKKCGPMSYG